MAETKKPNEEADLQTMEYTPAQEVEPTYSEAANPTKEIPNVVYAERRTAADKLASAMKGVYQGAAQKAREYAERKKAEKMMLEQSAPQQPIRKFSRQTIRPASPFYAPPESPLVRNMQGAFYEERNYPPARNMMVGVNEGGLSTLQKIEMMGGSAGFNSPKKMGKQALSPLQRMMGRNKPKPTFGTELMFGGKKKGMTQLQKIMGSKGKKKFGW